MIFSLGSSNCALVNDTFLYLQSNSLGHGWGNCITHLVQIRCVKYFIKKRERSDLSMFVKYVPKEAEGVGEALGPGTLSHTHHSVLLRVKHTPLLARET